MSSAKKEVRGRKETRLNLSTSKRIEKEEGEEK